MKKRMKKNICRRNQEGGNSSLRLSRVNKKRKGATYIVKHEMMNGTCRNHINFSSSRILVDNHHMFSCFRDLPAPDGSTSFRFAIFKPFLCFSNPKRIGKNILQIKLSTSHINHANLFIRREVEERQNRLCKAQMSVSFR